MRTGCELFSRCQYPDESKLEIRPVGSFFSEPARLRHFGITKDEGVILYFVGTGPSTNDDPEK